MYLLFDLVKNDSMTPVNTAGQTLYFSVVTITTLGYGDMCPDKPLGLFLTSVEPIMGIVLLVLVVGVFLVELSKKND